MRKVIDERLPEGWRWGHLGGEDRIAEIINGSTPSTDNPNYWNGDILWVTPADIGKLKSIYIEDTERKITKAGLESCSTKLLPTGTVLLTSRAPVGNMAITSKPLCTNQGFKSFIPREGINSLYLFFALKWLVPKIQRKSHGNTFTEITKELIQEFEIPLPPTLADQIAIADELEQQLAEVERTREAAVKQKEAVAALQGAMLREVFPYKEGDELPQRWEWVELESLFKIHLTQIERSNPEFYLLAFIGLENIESHTRQFVKGEENSEGAEGSCFVFDETYVLYGKLRPYLNKVYLPDKRGKCSLEILPLKPTEGYSREFVALVLQSKMVLDFAVKHSTGGRMPRANISKLKKLKVPIPKDPTECNALALEFAEWISEVSKCRRASETQSEAVEALATAKLRETFSFQTNVN